MRRWPTLVSLMVLVGSLAGDDAGMIADEALRECSGVVLGIAQREVLWAVNDGGNPAELFALDRQFATLGRLAIDAPNVDWEDLAIDTRGIYIGDIGDNLARRPSVAVLLVPEADPRARLLAPLAPLRRWTLTYPDGARDAEALVVRGEHGWIIDKRIGGWAHVWRFDLDGPDTQELVDTGELRLPGPVLAADIDDTGTWLAITNPLGLLVAPMQGGDPVTARPEAAVMIPMPLVLRRESCAFVPGGMVVAEETRTWQHVREQWWRP